MSQLTKPEIIKGLNQIIEEIKTEKFWKFYICRDSLVEYRMELAHLLEIYGQKYIDGFSIEPADARAFLYQDIKSLPGRTKSMTYNFAKLRHIELFIKHLEDGNDIYNQ